MHYTMLTTKGIGVGYELELGKDGNKYYVYLRHEDAETEVRKTHSKEYDNLDSAMSAYTRGVRIIGFGMGNFDYKVKYIFEEEVK